MDAGFKEFLEHKAFNIRRNIIQTIISNGEGHVGSALSCADILAVLYFGVLNIHDQDTDNLDNDKFILSAGHKCLALYGALVEKEIISKQILSTYNRIQSPVSGHPDMRKLRGVDFSTGSLGHGLATGCGLAKAAKMMGKKYRTFVLMGDGEQGEGSVWEAAGFAVRHELDNLTALVDRNGLQVCGTTQQVMGNISLEQRYTAWGWAVKTIDGHNVVEIHETLSSIPFEQGKPSMIICNTVKGKGLSFAENNYHYHHWNPDKIEAQTAMRELHDTACLRGWTL